MHTSAAHSTGTAWGRRMTSTPAKPSAMTAQRRKPARSPRKPTANRVAQIGVVAISALMSMRLSIAMP